MSQSFDAFHWIERCDRSRKIFDTYSLCLSLFLYCIIFIVIAIISPSCDYERRCSMAHFFVILSTSRYPAYCTIAPAKYEKGEFLSKKPVFCRMVLWCYYM